MPIVIERAPFHSLEAERPETPAGRASLAVFGAIVDHSAWIDEYLGLESNDPFRFDSTALEDRRRHIEAGREISHHTSRDISSIARTISKTTRQVEAEFDRETVLDIGCGEGRLGRELRRKAKTNVTFLDTDENVISKIPGRSGCNKVVGDGLEIPFEDDEYARTLSVFSSMHWAETPVDRVQAFNEALRVTQPDGSLFIIPAFSSLVLQREIAAVPGDVTKKAGKIGITVTELASKVWALQDHVLLHSMLGLARQDYCSITWLGEKTLETIGIEHYSAIVDKHCSIPPEALEENLVYAEEFMEIDD